MEMLVRDKITEEALVTVQELIEDKKFNQLKELLLTLQQADIAEIMESVQIKNALLMLRLLPKDISAEVFAYCSVEVQSEMTKLVNDVELRHLIEELYFDDMIDLLEEVPAVIVKKILKNATETERRLINQFLNYPDETAGSLMTIEFIDLRKEMSLPKAFERIRSIGIDKETIYTCYVTDNTRKLEGIVSLRTLVLAKEEVTINDLMDTDVIHVTTSDDQEYIAGIFKKYDLLSLPVVDHENRLVGIITIDDIVDVIEEETTEDFQRMAAIEPTEESYIHSKSMVLWKKRITWLVVLMFSAMLTEFITKFNGHILTSVAVLAAYMPMLMSTGGNTGSQSSTLIIRSLTLDEVDFSDLFKVLFKELKVGLMLGGTLAGLNFIRVLAFQRDIKIAAVIGLTLVCTTLFASLIGGSLPLIAKKLKLDPAIMAGPMISTIVDATTLLIFFNIASLMFSLS